MPFYESVFIARQDISAQQVDGLTENFKNIIESGNGKVVKVENWGLRTLAYRVKKNRKGHYVQFSIDSPSDAIAEMERLMGLNEDILRQMTIRVDEIDPNPSVMMQKSDRDDAPRKRRDFNEDTSDNTTDDDLVIDEGESE